MQSGAPKAKRLTPRQVLFEARKACLQPLQHGGLPVRDGGGELAGDGGVEARLELFERNTFNDDTFSTVAVAPLTPLAGTDEVEEAAQGEWILGVLEVEVLPKRLFGVKHGQMDLLEAGEGRWGQVWCVGW